MAHLKLPKKVTIGHMAFMRLARTGTLQSYRRYPGSINESDFHVVLQEICFYLTLA